MSQRDAPESIRSGATSQLLTSLVRATDLSRNGMLSYVRALRDAGLISDTEPTPNAAAGVPEFRERYARTREAVRR